MPAPDPVIVLAVTMPFVVAAALCREFLVLRAARRELDSYLHWLLEDAAGPVSVARLHPWC